MGSFGCYFKILPMKYMVCNRQKDGSNFEIIKVEFEEPFSSNFFKPHNVRGMIAMVILMAFTIFLMGTTVYGLITGDFAYLKTVSLYGQAPMGVIIGYYFGSAET